ncbi:MAG: protein translocase subunit SecF [Acidimicrobiia bacterium]|nr:protein translocase subunit SecF [Acidimicrobiia bacterium]
MSLAGRLYRAETVFDFVGNRRRWFLLSSILVLLSLGSLAVRQLNLSVDFEGGTVVEVENPAGADVAAVNDALSGIGRQGDTVQLIGGGTGIRVQTEDLTVEAEDRVIAAVAGVAGVEVNEASVESVGPTFGEEVARSALRALIVFIIVIALFISFRFEWRMAAAALAALVHDLVITAGVYSVVGFEVTPATVVAVLTILGYSLYDSVVVFDKVLEEIDYYGDERSIGDIVNLSMNLVLMRSINTSLTSLLPVGSLLFVGSYLLGAATLREFALALFVGIAAGTYSSIFVASPLLAVWKSKEEKWQRVDRKLARKASDEADAAAATAAASRGERPRVEETGRGQSSGAIARPPKRRKRKR